MDVWSDFGIKNGPNNGIKIVQNPSVSVADLIKQRVELLTDLRNNLKKAQQRMSAAANKP